MKIKQFKFILQHFRSFSENTTIELKPITLFLGRNSSGKSTITRMIPLFQQTFEARTSSPILWYGKSVDFGSARDVIPRDIKTNHMMKIGIQFTIDSLPIVDSRLASYYYDSEYAPFRLIDSTLSYTAYLNERNDRTFLSGFDLQVNDDSITVRAQPDGIIDSFLVNGNDLYTNLATERLRVRNRLFFGRIVRAQRENIAGRRNELIRHAKLRQEEILKRLVHGRTLAATISRMADDLNYHSKQEFLTNVLKLQESDFFHTNVKRKSRAAIQWIEDLRCMCLVRIMIPIIERIESVIQQVFAESAYTGPARASGLRYYRWQELALDRLDPEGQNFAMYLMSLSNIELRSFADLVKIALGYEVKPDRGKGYASIMVREESSAEWYNLADVGYGLSQILPVVAQLHAVMYRTGRGIASNSIRYRGLPRLLAIEQPELHLHPALQARIADLFAATINRSGGMLASSDLRIIVETHSEALVNRFADLVVEGKLKSDDIAVYIFDWHTQSGTSVQKANITSDGTIENWPVGFFMGD